MDVGGWLRSLGLAQYEPMFRAHEIDSEVLPELSEGDLEKLGMPLGHRKRLMKAIAALGDRSAAPAEKVSAPIEPAPRESAERRYLTVMFCDLVGSTALSTKLDPEDLRVVMGTYHKCVAATVARFDGFVAKYMGDGVLIYFGYPQAHEHDAERSVRTGLALITAVSALQSPVPLQVRVGIATGLVVVGDMIGSGEAQERGIVGETPNLAARLQGIAEPNMVIIAESTRRLVGSLFELEDLGSKDLKGISGPVRAWSAVRASSLESRFEALHAAGLTALVGREEETELLQRRWSRAKSGEGQVVLLSGEAGIGKSRLTAALLEQLAGEPHTRLRYFCSPQHTDSALHPIIGQMERAAELTHDDKPQAKLDKLEALLAQTSTSIEDIALFAEMLSLSNDGHYPALALLPEQRRQRTLDALTAQMDALTRKSPILMILEDAHWIDPTSMELFGRVVDRIRNLRVLLIVTFRPEFEAPWIGRPHVTALTINRLAQRDIDAMIDRVVGGESLSASIRKDIIERTDGIPLFVEEMTKAVLEAENEPTAEHLAAAVPHPTLSVPASLHASLMARLDRLGSAKEVAQIGAATGREFSHALLAAVVTKPEAELASALDRLVEAGLLFRQGIQPHTTYLFKHALVQDAAYGTLLRAKRQELHARIADVLEEKFPETTATQPEILARHCGEAGLTRRAIAYWQRAGERAAHRSANVEAIAHFKRGLDLIEASPDAAGHAEEELALLIALGPVLMATRSSAAPEVSRLYSRARVLAQQLGRSAKLYTAFWGAWLVSLSEGDVAAATRFVDDLFAIARDQSDPDLVLQAHHAAWSTVMVEGDLIGTRRHIEAGLGIYVRERHARQAHLYGAHDAAVCGRSHLAWALALLGFPDQALQQMDLALALGRDLAHPPSLVHALWSAAELRYMRREPRAIEECTALLEPIAAQHGSVVVLANATMLRGWALVARGFADEGLAELRKGLSQWRSTGSQYQVPNRLARAADAFRAARQIEEGLVLVDEAIGLVEKGASRWEESEVHRLKGELLQASAGDLTNSSECERCFNRALDVARRQSAKLLELRAASSLARLWRVQGKCEQARDLLGSIYGWFTEGFDTTDLKGAKALLDKLAK